MSGIPRTYDKDPRNRRGHRLMAGSKAGVNLPTIISPPSVPNGAITTDPSTRHVLVDTRSRNVTVTLGNSPDGTYHRIVNASRSGKLVTIEPTAPTLLLGKSEGVRIGPGDAQIFVFSATLGWW